MFRRRSTESLTLDIHEESFSFGSPKDLEFALSGRTCLPSSKIGSLIALSDEALLREAEAIRAIEQRFADALSGSLEDFTSISPFLKDIDLTSVTQDHDWRAIITSLNTTDRAFEEYKKVALVKYMQYLTSRQEVVKTLYSHRKAQRALASGSGENGAGQAAAGMNPGETLIFDLSAIAAAREHQEVVEFARIPKGETVEIEFDPAQTVELLLAKHRCSIVRKDGLVFVDDKGAEKRLRSGKSIVGRDSSSDILMDSSFRDVSRKHLIVETDGQALVRLIDISSHGTSVPPEFLENTSI